MVRTGGRAHIQHNSDSGGRGCACLAELAEGPGIVALPIPLQTGYQLCVRALSTFVCREPESLRVLCFSTFERNAVLG